jgi:hypothetical protein
MNWWNTQIHKIHSVRVGRGKIPIAEVSLGGRIGVSDTKEYESRVYPVSRGRVGNLTYNLMPHWTVRA